MFEVNKLYKVQSKITKALLIIAIVIITILKMLK